MSRSLLTGISRARAAARDGYPFAIWIGGRYHDSAATHTDAFEECRAQRRAGVRAHMAIDVVAGGEA